MGLRPFALIMVEAQIETAPLTDRSYRGGSEVMSYFTRSWGSIYLTKQSAELIPQGACKAAEIEVTPAMIDAGADRLMELGDAVSTTYLVTEVFLAMWRNRAKFPQVCQDFEENA